MIVRQVVEYAENEEKTMHPQEIHPMLRSGSRTSFYCLIFDQNVPSYFIFFKTIFSYPFYTPLKSFNSHS